MFIASSQLGNRTCGIGMWTTTALDHQQRQEAPMSDTAGIRERLKELRHHGKMQWSEIEHVWAGEPVDVVEALAHEGFAEYKREVARSRRDRPEAGGVWQGLDSRTGIVASAIWVHRDAGAVPIVFIEGDGELLDGNTR
jgi:hypothetical protein